MESKCQRKVAAGVENGIYKVKTSARVAEKIRPRIYGNFTGNLRIDCRAASTESISEVSLRATIAAFDALRSIPSA